MAVWRENSPTHPRFPDFPVFHFSTSPPLPNFNPSHKRTVPLFQIQPYRSSFQQSPRALNSKQCSGRRERGCLYTWFTMSMGHSALHNHDFMISDFRFQISDFDFIHQHSNYAVLLFNIIVSAFTLCLKYISRLSLHSVADRSVRVSVDYTVNLFKPV